MTAGLCGRQMRRGPHIAVAVRAARATAITLDIQSATLPITNAVAMPVPIATPPVADTVSRVPTPLVGVAFTPVAIPPIGIAVTTTVPITVRPAVPITTAVVPASGVGHAWVLIAITISCDAVPAIITLTSATSVLVFGFKLLELVPDTIPANELFAIDVVLQGSRILSRGTSEAAMSTRAAVNGRVDPQ
jgi:hypothetical protein